MKFLERVQKMLSKRDGVLETPDPTPVAVPVRLRPPESTDERIMRMMRGARVLAQQEGAESFEEANDFECDDDWDPLPASNHEYDRELELNDRAIIKNPPKRSAFQEEVPAPRKAAGGGQRKPAPTGEQAESE